MKLPDHLFISECGDLFNTRIENWHKKPLRKKYQYHHRAIKTARELKACLRAGRFTGYGGYEVAFITKDGAILCFDCVIKEFKNIIHSIKTDCNDGWQVCMLAVIEHDLHDDDDAAACDHCYKDFKDY